MKAACLIIMSGKSNTTRAVIYKIVSDDFTMTGNCSLTCSMLRSPASESAASNAASSAAQLAPQGASAKQTVEGVLHNTSAQEDWQKLTVPRPAESNIMCALTRKKSVTMGHASRWVLIQWTCCALVKPACCSRNQHAVDVCMGVNI